MLLLDHTTNTITWVFSMAGSKEHLRCINAQILFVVSQETIYNFCTAHCSHQKSIQYVECEESVIETPCQSFLKSMHKTHIMVQVI